MNGRLDKVDGDEQHGVVVEGIALVLSILSVAAWAKPLSHTLGPHALARAIGVALPTAVALQWALRSRYLSRRAGLALLARDGLVCAALVALAVELPLALVPGWGPIAALLVATWTAGIVMTRRGWGLPYAVALVASAIALDQHLSAYLVLGLLTAFTLSGCLAGVLTERAATDDRPGSVRRSVIAGVLGGSIGALMVDDRTLGWGVHGVHPAIALVPSVVGSLWGGYYLWNLYEAVPRGLSGVSLGGASRLAVRDPAMAVFAGALVRLIGVTVILSVVVVGIDHWLRGSDALSVFIAFGAVAVVSMMVALLESLGRQAAALVAMAAALGAEFLWPHVIHLPIAGGGLIAGTVMGIIFTVPPLIVLLSRSGRLLATTLWIH